VSNLDLVRSAPGREFAVPDSTAERVDERGRPVTFSSSEESGKVGLGTNEGHDGRGTALPFFAGCGFHGLTPARCPASMS